MNPFPGAFAYWTLSNGAKTEVANPADGDDWYNQDSDSDGLSNSQEVTFGSDPYRLDSDFDGLADSVEYQYSLSALEGGQALPYDPWNWDSNGNGNSDFDEYYQQIQNYIPQVNYASLQQGSYYSYSDADGDGLKNFEDSDPLNCDRDGDGILNWNDSYMDDPYNGMGPQGERDSDGDGVPDASDPFPYGSYFYQGIEYGGSWSDRDNDGVPDPADPFPDGSYWYNAVEYALPYVDQDGDTIPDVVDPWPTIAGSYEYNGTTYPGAWSDRDNDTIPDPADPFPDGSYWWNGTEYAGAWMDSDNDGTPDAQDPLPYGDPDSDGDGTPDSQDAYPSDPWNGQPHYNYNGTEYPGVWVDSDNDGIPDSFDETPNGDPDSDGDGTPDSQDPYPNDAWNGQPHFSYNGVEYAGNWADADGDGIPDVVDPIFSGLGYSYWWNGVEYAGNWVDDDGDGTPNDFDAFPNGSYWYNGTEYAGAWSDSDGDGIPDAQDSWPSDSWNDAPHYTYQGNEYPGVYNDRDGDGIPDGLDAYPDDPTNNADTDNDGISDYDENTQYHTDPAKRDTDDDGLSDFDELFTYHTDPLQAKTNPNQLYPDYDMVDQTDTDSDGIPDRVEQFYASQGYGMNPNDASDANGDLDGDGYTNVQAWRNGWSLIASLNGYDDDHDGILDVLEDAWNAAYPGILSNSSAADATQDFDGDGLMNFEEIALGLNPGSAHSRVASVNDLQEWAWRGKVTGSGVAVSFHGAVLSSAVLPEWQVTTDADHDGVPDGLATFVAALQSSPGLLTLPVRMASGDYDGDGMRDCWEHRYNLDLRNAADVLGDPDGDGLTNLVEYRFQSNPLVRKTNNNPTDDDDRLYDTSIAAYDLNGQTVRYQPQLVADYTGTRDDVPQSFTAYRTGESEDPPDDSLPPPKLYVLVQPYIQDINQPESDPASAANQWRPLGENESKVVSGDSLRIQGEANAAPFYWDAQSGTTKQALSLVGDDYWIQDQIKMKVVLTETVANDQTFKFLVTNSNGDSNTITKTIFGGQTSCEVSAEAPSPQGNGYGYPDGYGWAEIEFLGADSGDDPPEDEGGAPGSVSGSDGAGSRYRKLSLMGIPLPDAKPQVQDESGEREEETHIDAFNRHLQHGVTDIYATDPSTLLPLSVRRDATSESWTRQGGLRPSERPDLPFGPCWSSNLCAFVRFEIDTLKPLISAEIHDEQGAVQRFLTADAINWEHSREEMSNARTLGNSFDGVVLKKKFGTTCTYTMCSLEQDMTRNRIEGSDEDLVSYLYARLTEVKDRLGNRLLYEYANDTTLIPSRVYDPDRPGRQIYVMHQNGRVTSVRGPAGEEVTYNNTDAGLTSVTRGDATVQYGYVNRTETKSSVNSPDTDGADTLDAHYHTELASITDELNRTYSFGYEYDHSVVYVHSSAGGNPTERYRLGLPMQIKQVMLPDGQTVTLSGNRLFTSPYGVNPTVNATATATTDVTGPAGSFHYAFTEPFVFVPTQEGPGLDDDTRSLNITVTYTQLAITSPGGTESYIFNPNAMFALSSATDLSGNTHSFTYGADGFDDPVRETDALGYFKDFTYDATTRVMTSMTDQTGVVTSYQIQPVTGLKLSETVTGAGGAVERQSTFQYNHPTYKGFMTQSTVDAAADDTAPATVTNFTLGSGSGGWAEVTTSTPTATGDVSSTMVHDFSGNKRSVIDGRGMVTNFDYDAHLRLTRVTNADNTHKDLVYDAHGNLVKETNENGVATFHDYDVLNRRIKTTLDLNGNGSADSSYGTNLPGVDGSSITYGGDIVATTTYNARGQVLTQTDPRGKMTAHTYDGAGRLISTDDGGLVTTMEYGTNSGGSVFDSSGFKPTKITDPRGTVTLLTHDKMYRTTEQTVDAEGIAAKTCTHYDAAGRPTRVRDALGRVTLTVYDVFGQIQQVTHPDSTIVSTDYTHHGKPWKVVDELGHITKTEFDEAGRAVKSIAPAIGGVSATTSTAYDAASNVIRVTDPLGHVTESQYDERNRVVATYAPPVWDAEAGAFVRPATQSTYDALGQVLTVTDPQGHVTTKLYDRAGRNWQVIAPAVDGTSPTVVTQFDPGGLARVVTNPLGQTVTNAYDIHGRMTQTTDAVGIVNTFAYDAAGNRTSVKDGKDQETTFGYDGLNRLTWQTFANGDTISHTYDAVRKLSQTSPRGITTTYTYDTRDRVTATSAPDLNRTHGYDAAGHLLSVTEATNTAANVSYTYDALGRVLTETSRGVEHSYGYDLAGNRTQADYGTGRSVQTSYDALHRPESLVEGDRATRYGYDLGGRAVILMAGNGQVTRNSYDALGRLTDRTLFRTQAMSGGDVMAQFDWQHDLLGNVTNQSETWPGEPSRSGVRTTTMAYDGNNRLTTETVTDPTAGLTMTAYTYDSANNRVKKQVTGGTDPGVWNYSYNSANQLTNWDQWNAPGGDQLKTATLTYDESGNRVSQNIVRISGGNDGSINPVPTPDGLTTYQWDAQDRLSVVTQPDSTKHTYDYDYRTRRIGMQRERLSVRQTMTAIVFAGGLSVAEFESGSDTFPISPSVEYVRGPDMGGGVGGMLYSIRAEGPKYSLSNGRGDIVAQADSSATLTWTASYEAYGRRTQETGSNSDKQCANTKDEDPTGLLNEGFRYRDLETGVWLSRDPAGFVDGPNLYAYVTQNPWTNFDPDGLYQEAGHYYTTYMVAVAAGWSKSDAYDLAYHSQMPDETPELTAFDSVWKTGAKILRGDSQLRRNQQHLHSLTGGKGRGAVAERRAQLKGLASTKGLSIEMRGLIVHAFGDSFAHTRTRGVEVQNDRSTNQDAAYGRPFGHAGAGHLPDLISARPELFNSYVDNLAEALSKANGTKINSAKLNAIKNLAISQAEANRAGLASPFRQGLVGRSETNAFESLANSQFGLADHMKKTGSTYDPSPNGKDTMSLDPKRPPNFSKANEAIDLIERRTSKKK
ncbi:RHS repeat-associated core domain-containing protein [Prosthecobacter sp.]|uniref:RHS repeat-associated core domain-containing protein n=1 Tax=Prosthecobacter sp. TaxID=1965333 RepID=UPI003783D36A